MKSAEASTKAENLITLFLCGDVMTARGIDQILPFPGNPLLHEPYVKHASMYVELAERKNGPIPRPVDFSYIWGIALEELDRAVPDVRIINLETAITASDAYWRSKGIHYRMHPKNIPCISAARIDCCVLANNHVLDWGYPGLKETLQTLEDAGLKTAGAGSSLEQAEAPAVMNVAGKGRVVVFAFGSETSGIPAAWAALDNRPGVNLLEDLSTETVRHIREKVETVRREGDILVASIHWGGNWGYAVPADHVAFAHQLIDMAGFDIIHGHSSHHAKAIEIYRERPIFYGCGDFLNDYEGISGYEDFRGDLSLMYFVSLDPSTGKLARLRMVPTQMRKLRVEYASAPDVLWLSDTLNRECEAFGARVEMELDNTLNLYWD